jgi:hypothetical protein
MNFITSLLNKRVNERACSLDLIKQDPFFHNFPWNELIDFKMKAPYVPESQNVQNLLSNVKMKYLEKLSKVPFNK